MGYYLSIKWYELLILDNRNQNTVGVNSLKRDIKGIFWVIEMLYHLNEMVLRMHAFVKTHQFVFLISIHLIVGTS